MAWLMVVGGDGFETRLYGGGDMNPYLGFATDLFLLKMFEIHIYGCLLVLRCLYVLKYKLF